MHVENQCSSPLTRWKHKVVRSCYLVTYAIVNCLNKNGGGGGGGVFKSLKGLIYVQFKFTKFISACCKLNYLLGPVCTE